MNLAAKEMVANAMRVEIVRRSTIGRRSYIQGSRLTTCTSGRLLIGMTSSPPLFNKLLEMVVAPPTLMALPVLVLSPTVGVAGRSELEETTTTKLKRKGTEPSP